MKSYIKYSIFAIVLTVAIPLALYIGCLTSIHEKPVFITLLILLLALLIPALFYGAGWIQATPEYVIMGSPLRKRRIPVSEIESITPFQPTMGAIRLCASGGFLGYWGLFREGDIGRYYGYYGRASDCFLLRMKNGDKYVLGCKNPEAMIKYISAHLTSTK
ncbi:MAG: PH domain-containing protein [Muribaculaceae bacterium]|nr:PH domain-containing protein [Muribaculaceae bacterium]